MLNLFDSHTKISKYIPETSAQFVKLSKTFFEIVNIEQCTFNNDLEKMFYALSNYIHNVIFLHCAVRS